MPSARMITRLWCVLSGRIMARTFLIRVKNCIFGKKVFVIGKKVVFLHSNSKEQRTIKNSISNYVSDKREKRGNIRRVR